MRALKLNKTSTGAVSTADAVVQLKKSGYLKITPGVDIKVDTDDGSGAVLGSIVPILPGSAAQANGTRNFDSPGGVYSASEYQNTFYQPDQIVPSFLSQGVVLQYRVSDSGTGTSCSTVNNSAVVPRQTPMRYGVIPYTDDVASNYGYQKLVVDENMFVPDSPGSQTGSLYGVGYVDMQPQPDDPAEDYASSTKNAIAWTTVGGADSSAGESQLQQVLQVNLTNTGPEFVQVDDVDPANPTVYPTIPESYVDMSPMESVVETQFGSKVVKTLTGTTGSLYVYPDKHVSGYTIWPHTGTQFAGVDYYNLVGSGAFTSLFTFAA